MSSTHHTAGRLTDMVLIDPPVTIHGTRVVSCVVDDQGREIADICDSSHLTEAQARGNARRLVACWNALDGMDTEQIEADTPFIRHGSVVADARVQALVDALAKTETYLLERVSSKAGSTGATVILPMIRRAIEGSDVKPTPSSWGDLPGPGPEVAR